MAAKNLQAFASNVIDWMAKVNEKDTIGPQELMDSMNALSEEASSVEEWKDHIRQGKVLLRQMGKGGITASVFGAVAVFLLYFNDPTANYIAIYFGIFCIFFILLVMKSFFGYDHLLNAIEEEYYEIWDGQPPIQLRKKQRKKKATQTLSPTSPMKKSVQ